MTGLQIAEKMEAGEECWPRQTDENNRQKAGNLSGRRGVSSVFEVGEQCDWIEPCWFAG